MTHHGMTEFEGRGPLSLSLSLSPEAAGDSVLVWPWLGWLPRLAFLSSSLCFFVV